MFTLLLSVCLLFTAQNTSSLQGVVLRAGTSEPVANVEISLFTGGLGAGAKMRSVSDSQGAFTFDNVPAGKYAVQARNDGYFTYPQGNPLPSTVENVTIEPARSHRIVVTLLAGAAVSGRITDSEGQPLAGVEVSATKLQYNDGRPVFSVGTVPVKTDDRGEYRIFPLPPGEYYVRAEFRNPPQQFARRVYYPGTTDSLAAVSLMIRGGESIEGTNFAIPRVRALRLSGQVVTEGPAPASGAVSTFYLMPDDGRPQERFPFELTNQIRLPRGEDTSSFLLETRGIPAGTYELAPFFLGPKAEYYTGRTRIEIREQDVENISAMISLNVEVTGKINVAGGLASPNPALQLQLRARDPTPPLMSRSQTATIANDGSFVIRDVPAGRYYLYVGAASGVNTSSWYVSGLRQGSMDIRNDGIVEVRGVTLPLEVTLSPGVGSVRGVVEAPGGVAPRRADVVLVPQFSRRENPLFYDRTGIDSDGSFTFQGIAPGEYKVFAFEQLPLTAEQNAAFIARYETLGQSVTVNSGSTTEVRARLLR
jgi:protocatechuate 3,4-dioxygenase beta subunit